MTRPNQLETNDIEWHTTEDGSITGKRKDLGIHYRSIHGAKTESNVVFVEGTGLLNKMEEWRVAELGFGLGCNFAHTAALAAARGVNLVYQAIDFQPPPSESVPESQPYSTLIKKALDTVRDRQRTITIEEGHVHLKLYPHHWRETILENERPDAIFHDPFAPANNPDCWTVDCFTWWKRRAKPTTRLATYSAAGHVRRALVKAGFWIAGAPGPGKKREITIASPSVEALVNLSLISKYKPQ